MRLIKYRLMEIVEQIAEDGNTTPAEIKRSILIGIIASPVVIASVYGMFALLYLITGII